MERLQAAVHFGHAGPVIRSMQALDHEVDVRKLQIGHIAGGDKNPPALGVQQSRVDASQGPAVPVNILDHPDLAGGIELGVGLVTSTSAKRAFS